jgi:diguanylate cyclase (GGDEF)-like protein
VSLRNRLWLVVGVLVVGPLLVGGVVLASLVSHSRAERVQGELRIAGRSVASALATTCRDVGLASRGLAASRESAGQAVQGVVEGGYGDYAALLRSDGQPVAEAGQASKPLPPSCAAGGAAATPVLAERTLIENGSAASAAVVATRVDQAYLDQVAASAGVSGSVTLADGDDVVATTASPQTANALARAQPDGAGEIHAAGQQGQVVRAGEGLPWTVIVSTDAPDSTGLVQAITLAFLVVLLLALVMGWLLARGLTRGLAAVTEAAEQVASGDLDQTADVRSGGEVARLGDAFNRMTAQLRRNVSALERSRDDLRDNLERLGEALGHTHDLEGLLDVVLQSAVAVVDARGGLALVADGTGGLGVVAVQGVAEQGLSVPARAEPGTGFLGTVFSSGRLARGRLGSADLPTPTPVEPGEGEVLAAPLRRGGRVVGVLAVYGRTDGTPFTAEHEDTLRSLAGQAGIAVDNVLLHREAQRLSITDPLTGLWNFRYLSMSLAREIERASRFGRPLAVLMLDLDHFKQVNDAWGHGRGDAVLRELASRVSEQIREVDTFARYGGEEFVLVLPETTAEGATMLADRVCAAVRREPFGSQVEGSDVQPPIPVTVSIGIASFPDNGASAATLMRTADEALYAAKRDGRDRWVLAGARHASGSPAP